MPWIDLLRWLHVIGATVLFGTGAGITFFMLAAHRTRNPVIVAHVAATVITIDITIDIVPGRNGVRDFGHSADSLDTTEAVSKRIDRGRQRRSAG